MKPVKELYYNAMKQVDDGRPGMALELGMNFFSDGNPALNVSFISMLQIERIFKEMLRQLLISAYTRLDDRDLYAEILDAHLRDRRKENGSYIYCSF